MSRYVSTLTRVAASVEAAATSMRLHLAARRHHHGKGADGILAQLVEHDIKEIDNLLKNTREPLTKQLLELAHLDLSAQLAALRKDDGTSCNQ